MKRKMVLGILSLTVTISASAQNNQTVPNAPFIVQPASFFQPFQATAPFYINSQYHPNPPFVPNLPYNPTPNYSEPKPPAVIPEIAVPEAKPLQPVPVEQLIYLEQPSQEPGGEPQLERGAGPAESQVIREKPSPESGAVSLTSAPSAVFALKSGALLETQNYVIAGNTVLISSGKDSRRIKVSELDLAKTLALNQQRGIHFSLPQ
jgi:hypothetical protein